MLTEVIEHTDEGVTFEAYVARPAAGSGRLPCVLVGHAWDGQNDVVRASTEELAALGYVGFALDVYGKGRRGEVMGDNSWLMAPLLEDRGLLRRRLLAGLAAARRLPFVDPQRIAVLGHCFGGLCALDLARAAPEGLVAAISIHGLLLLHGGSRDRREGPGGRALASAARRVPGARALPCGDAHPS